MVSLDHLAHRTVEAAASSSAAGTEMDGDSPAEKWTNGNAWRTFHSHSTSRDTAPFTSVIPAVQEPSVGATFSLTGGPGHPSRVQPVRSNTGFRSPFDPDVPSPRSESKGRRSSGWLEPIEMSGIKSFVEEPTELVSDENSQPSPTKDAADKGRARPSRSATSYKGGKNRDASQSRRSSQTEKSMTWDSAVRRMGLRRHNSLPHIPDIPVDSQTPTFRDEEKGKGSPRTIAARMASRHWAIIKHRLAPGQATGGADGPASAVDTDLNISDELMVGGLASLMIRMHFDRDEHDQRRVPVLLHHLKIKISDSAHPLSGSHSVFRIECEYANGAARWVIYRQIRDFVSLHTHYRVANVYGRADLSLPEFPMISIPYFKFLKSQTGNVPANERRASFARLQRRHLENYLLALIKCVMFRPEANRLSRFFEISALSVALAKTGGVQGKAGLLRVTGGEASRRSFDSTLAMFGLGRAGKPRWWNVRESYLVAVDDPGDTTIYDVFLIDTDFSIEKPRRYYRKLDITHFGDIGGPSPDGDNVDDAAGDDDLPDPNAPTPPRVGTWSRISARLQPSWPSKRSKHSSANGDAGENSHPISPTSSNGHSVQKTHVDQQTIAKNSTVHSGNWEGKSKDTSHHTFYIQNSQRRLKLVAKNERQLDQWITSMERMAEKSHWTKSNRFGSFAPIRLNVAAQWLVDGRDYFWNLSRAISLAKEAIYIHDWWLSPEIQMRRPNKHHYRIDQLLKARAEAGVKIFVIIYKEVSNRTTPTDSNYTKQRLVKLHPNIMVQRSPSHFSTGTFYWAHHEKLCVIDETIAFMGGLDMCFGRWDTPQHALVDDPEDPQDQIWPGKDYANDRVVGFHTLTKPHEDMCDRSKIPRMPWHDVGLQILGQPARDLSRHFIQRWNHLLRVKSHTRIMPFLTPPSEFVPRELDKQGLTGTCELQVCRSAGGWSMGFQHRMEHSVQNAYLKAIQMSEHFVYIENQFFITSTVVSDVKIENQIGDALVSRIINAHHSHTPWRACIVLPLLPGFTFPIDHGDASALRLILECQNRTISRGPHSIFVRLRKEGINPSDYMTFFALRTWGKLRGDVLATEQLYVHAKIMIVDDRLAIIGSANINERSQRGDRDSELASVIRDTDMIDSTMGGKPFKVGRFAHTLRMRLMREHLGVDVDAMHSEDPMTSNSTPPEPNIKRASHEWEPTPNISTNEPQEASMSDYREKTDFAMSTSELKVENNQSGVDRDSHEAQGSGSHGHTIEQDSVASLPVTKEPLNTMHTDGNMHDDSKGKPATIPVTKLPRQHHANKGSMNPWSVPTPKPIVDPNGFKDPISDAFFKDVWMAAAFHNTEIFRRVFHCIPDDSVTTWKQYKEFIQHQERHNRHTKGASTPAGRSEASGRSAPDGMATAGEEHPIDRGHTPGPTEVGGNGDVHDPRPSVELEHDDEGRLRPSNAANKDSPRSRTPSLTRGGKDEHDLTTTTTLAVEGASAAQSSRPRRPTHIGEPFEQWERDAMEELLKELRGPLVIYPTRFLEGEDVSDNFLFNTDKLLPLPIYN